MSTDEEKRQAFRQKLKALYSDISELYAVREDFLNLGDESNDDKYASFYMLRDILNKSLADYGSMKEEEWPEWVKNAKKACQNKGSSTCKELILQILVSFVTKGDLSY
jgi:hypothetical protein